MLLRHIETPYSTVRRRENAAGVSALWNVECSLGRARPVGGWPDTEKRLHGTSIGYRKPPFAASRPGRSLGRKDYTPGKERLSSIGMAGKRSSKTKRFVQIVVLLAGLFGCIAAATAGEAPSPGEAWTFSLYFENDLFGGTDHNYTNGVKLSGISPDLSGYRESEEIPRWALPWIQKLPFINTPGLQRNLGLSIGQSMYTPQDTSRSSLVRDDRPYAGWTYLGVAFHSKDTSRLDTLEFQAGIVGPSSCADETQRMVHRLRGLEVPSGWDHQLHNEPGLALVYERKCRVLDKRRIGGPGLDAITHLGAALGNVSTYANAGIELRAGWNLPADFGDALIRPAGDTNAPVSARDPRLSGQDGFSLYAFGAISGRAVLHDIFLDGNTFKNSHSVDKEPLVADLSAGVCLVFGRFKLSYAQVIRTREFERQEKHHKFGSVTLSVSF